MSSWVQVIRAFIGERQRELFWLCVLLSSTFSTLSLIGFDASDPTLWSPGTGLVNNPCGPLGALVAEGLYGVCGFGAWSVFLGMVWSVLALAGRGVPSLGKGILALLLGSQCLALVELVLPSTAHVTPGGLIGRTVLGSAIPVVGHAGALLGLLGGGALVSTVLFDIHWRAVFSVGVEAIEGRLPIVKQWASEGASSLFGRFRMGTVALLRSTWDWFVQKISTMRNGALSMGRSLIRDETDPGHWTEVEDEEFASSVPGTFDVTVAGGGMALAEVEWDPTEDSDKSSVVLGLFPEMEPRNVQIRPDSQAISSKLVDAVSEIPDAGESTQPGQDRYLSIGVRGGDTAVRPASQVTPVREEPADPERAQVAPIRVDIEVERTPVVPRIQNRNEDASASDSVPPAIVPVAIDPGLDPVQVRPDVAASAQSQQVVKVQVAPGAERAVQDDGKALVKPQWGGFELPPLSLLNAVPRQRVQFDAEELQQLARRVVQTCEDFKVPGQVTNVEVGPVVTTFEFLPAKGVRVQKVASLADDLAMNLRANSVRIQAPIPGKGVCGIEIPSPERLTIFYREVIADQAFRKTKAALPCILGKDVNGEPVIADLARMPHVLVAGTTGAGKSVGVNGMMASMLYTKSPDDLRLLLIDPKQLEFKMYDDVPHLLHPVITEPKMAAAALEWACKEMDDRYALLAGWDTRNIANYNAKVEREVQDWTPEKARRYAPLGWPKNVEPPPPRKMPYIVVVIDELADLMMVAKKEIETSICRLAQKARACGIHLVLATQRPSADVVTGLIKSNMPTRMAYKLRSALDSRVILDENGAEKLLGRGDMLYLANDGSTTSRRVHGAFLADEEVEKLCDYLRSQGKPDYIEAVTALAGPATMAEEQQSERDAIFDQVVEFVIERGKASTSMVQRRFRIGYNRAARIVDQLEAAGIVGPADGARAREILV